MQRVLASGLLVGIALLVPVQSFATTITLDATDRGWYMSDGSSNDGLSTSNYIVGNSSGYLFRDWFEFDLSSVSGTIVAATLLLDNPANGFSSPDGTETYTIFDVLAANYAGLGIDSLAIFTDLGSGTTYGSFNATSAANGTTVSVALNVAALAALNAAVGSPFAVGGAITTLNGVEDEEYLFGFSTTGYNTRLELTTDVTAVPEPTSVILLGTGLAGAVVRRLRRRRR